VPLALFALFSAAASVPLATRKNDLDTTKFCTRYACQTVTKGLDPVRLVSVDRSPLKGLPGVSVDLGRRGSDDRTISLVQLGWSTKTFPSADFDFVADFVRTLSMSAASTSGGPAGNPPRGPKSVRSAATGPNCATAVFAA